MSEVKPSNIIEIKGESHEVDKFVTQYKALSVLNREHVVKVIEKRDNFKHVHIIQDTIDATE